MSFMYSVPCFLFPFSFYLNSNAEWCFPGTSTLLGQGDCCKTVSMHLALNLRSSFTIVCHKACMIYFKEGTALWKIL